MLFYLTTPWVSNLHVYRQGIILGSIILVTLLFLLEVDCRIYVSVQVQRTLRIETHRATKFSEHGLGVSGS